MSDPNRAAEKAAKQAAKKAAYEEQIATLPPFVEWPKIARLNRDIVITEKIDGTNAAIGIVPIQGVDGSDVFKVYAQSRTRIITVGNDNFGFAQWVETHREALIKALGPGLHIGEWWGVGIGRHYNLSERRFSLFNTARWSRPEGQAALEVARAEGAAIYVVPTLYVGPWTGIFGYKDGDTGEWLTAPQNWDVFDAEAAKHKAMRDEIYRRVREVGDQVEGDEIIEQLDAALRFNPRPRFAPNFIMEWLKRVGSQAAPGFMNPEGIVVFHRVSGTILKATAEHDEKHKGEV